MKKHAFKLFALFILFSHSLSAQNEKEKNKTEPKFKKTKTVSKTYALSGSDRVKLENQFGKMQISTWDRNEVKVEIIITGKSDEEARAGEILDLISIEEGKRSGEVYFKTRFENTKDKKEEGKKHRNEGMNIDYTVQLPAGATLEVSNQFGPMTIPDYRGALDLTSKFGELTAGKLTNNKVLNVEFGKATIGQVSGGKLNIKFSEGTVSKMSGEVETNIEFSNVKLDLDNDIKNLQLRNNYSALYLDLDRNFGANWEIQTSHGELSNKTSFAIKEEGAEDKGYGPRFTKNYKGVSGNGGASIKIHSSFGEVIVGHDLQVDLSRKKKGPRERVI